VKKKEEAHIRADCLQVGGVIWPGYLNIKNPGVALFRELADYKESDEQEDPKRKKKMITYLSLKLGSNVGEDALVNSP